MSNADHDCTGGAESGGVRDPECPGCVEMARAEWRERRESKRRAIDALIREDARRYPAFATARRAAVLAAFEKSTHHDVPGLLARLHAHEDGTEMPPGGGPWDWEAFDAYSRCRSLP